MPITRINATMRVRPLVVACPPPGGVFTVTVTVAGTAEGRGGSYDVEIYDEDVIRDDLLDGNYANGVLAGAFRNRHVFFLNCNNTCKVAGPLGSSGESDAEVYAYVNGGRNVTGKSPTVTLKCSSAPAPKPRQEQKPPTQRRRKAASA